MDAPLLAPTPAEFWRRYNRPVQQFFHENVFKPAGGMRSPIRATLIVFAVSALVHEYVFGITLGRVQGYQTLFFLLQGCAAAATVRVRPAGWRFWPWFAATWIFNLATSLLFFASLNGVMPFYSRELPRWLAGW
jgi:D-alanyl-lipoteichoic acid acyltransferase DltB (MBOAT superfamily)